MIRLSPRGMGLVLAVIVAIAGLLALRTEPANADHNPCNNWYGRSCWNGYFSGEQATTGLDVVVGGMPGMTTGGKQAFISTVTDHLNSADPQRITAAQFIILSMLGSGSGVPRSVTPAQLNEWQQRINNPDIQMVVGTVLFECDISNTYYQIANNDIAAGTSVVADGCNQLTEVIDFRYNGDLVYRIRAACANPLGGLPGLPAVPPTVTQCGVLAIQPLRPELGDSIVVRPSIEFSGGPGTPTLSSPKIEVRNAAGLPGTVGGTATLGNGQVAFTSASFTLPSPGQYTVRWSAIINGTLVTCGGLYAPSDSFTVLSYPFVKVNGGDTITGVSFGAPYSSGSDILPCHAATHNPKAGVVSSNTDTGSYSGAGGSYAVFAMGYIQSFASDQGKARGPTSLAFSNVDYPVFGAGTVQVSAGRFGGLFGTAPCMDYWERKPADSQLAPLGPGSLNTLSGHYLHTGNLTIGNTRVQARNRLTIYVKGDVNITGDIVYQNNNTSWRDTSDIPSFNLIVNGRIFVESSVNQLDGLYVGIPNSNYVTGASSFGAPAAGTIITCSDGFSVRNPQLAATNNMANNCNRRLTVNGSFIANQIWLLRTFGNLSANEPAEVFNFTPELWLAPSAVDLNSSYDTLTGLPPIL